MNDVPPSPPLRRDGRPHWRVLGPSLIVVVLLGVGAAAWHFHRVPGKEAADQQRRGHR